VNGHDEINQLVGQLLASCTFEFLALHPNARSAAVLRRDMAIDLELAQRQGMVFRSLYPESERSRPEIVEIVAALSAAGAEYRTISPLPGRLFLFDTHTAVIAVPSPDMEQQWVACCVTDPPAVAYLRNLYGQLWERAQPIGGTGATANPPALEGIQREVLALLHEGLTHIQIGRRLGLTQRTVATYISQLKQACNVESLYQLGAAAARLGLLGS
jgi:DNA-binding CsgD family transcriptional regulator